MTLMAFWYSQQIIRHIAKKGLVIQNLEILLMGFTFKTVLISEIQKFLIYIMIF